MNEDPQSISHVGDVNVVGQLTFLYHRAGDLEGVTSFVSLP